MAKSFWSTFYRNLKIECVTFIINCFNVESHYDSLKNLMILLNEEQLKYTRFCIVYNVVNRETKSSTGDSAYSDKPYDISMYLNELLQESPLHDYETRVTFHVFDIDSLKNGDEASEKLIDAICGKEI